LPKDDEVVECVFVWLLFVTESMLLW